MPTVNIFRSAFTHKFETIHEIENKAIKYIIKDDLDNAVIFVDGFERDGNYILKNGELCTVGCFLPGNREAAGLKYSLASLRLERTLWRIGSIFSNIPGFTPYCRLKRTALASPASFFSIPS
jgi:hypothetical protein